MTIVQLKCVTCLNYTLPVGLCYMCVRVYNVLIHFTIMTVSFSQRIYILLYLYTFYTFQRIYHNKAYCCCIYYQLVGSFIEKWGHYF